MMAGSLGALLERSRRGAPEHPAIVASDGTTTSYRALARAVNGVAAAVRDRGVGPGRSVAVVMANGPLMAEVFLGVSSAAACAPLNPAYPEPELRYYYDDLDVAALVTDGCSEMAVTLAEARGIPVLQPPFDGDDIPVVASPDDAALVLHTSGTTGRPKQVRLQHRNLAASAENIARTLQLGPDDVCLNVMPLFHIHGLMGALSATVASGGAVVCTAGFDPARFFDDAVRLGATWYTAVPTIHHAVLAAARREPDAVARCRFRLIRSSSAALPPVVMAELEAVFDAPVVEAYGMTEASHQMASNPLPPAVRKPGTVGRPAGCDIGIMGPDGTLFGPGETGDIVIRGPGVMSGYAGVSDDVNAEAFAHGWFHTGDEGALDDDGYLTISGRTKEIINRGGEKVAPREVDEVLLEHPAVARAVAFAVPHPTLGEDVAAAVVPSAELDVDEVRAFVAQRLAAHKVPSRILVVDDIPTGPTGKVQRVGLAERLGLGAAGPGGERAPVDARALSPLEAAIAGVWADALRRDRVGVDDRFVEIGGDSLIGVALVAQIADVFGVELPLTSPLVEAPTVARMAALVTEYRQRPVARSPEPEIDQGAEGDEGALSLAQEAMWVLEALDPGTSTLHVPIVIRLRGPLDVGALERSIDTLVQRHESLRTGFTSADDATPRAFVVDRATVPLKIEERPGIAADVRAAMARDIVRAAAAAPFDLLAPPLVHACLVRFDADDHALGVVVHHLVADGYARGIVRNELAVLYAAERAGGAADLPPAPTFSEYVRRERRRLDDGSLDASVAHWSEVLTPPPPPVLLPADRRQPVEDHASDVVWATLAEADRSALADLARAHDATLFMVLLSGFVAAVHRHTGLTDVVVGVPAAGRTDLRSHDVIGSFVNELPVRVAVDGELSFVDLLRRVRSACLAAYEHQMVPLEHLVRVLRPERSAVHRPLVQVTMQLRNLPPVVAAFDEIALEDIDIAPPSTHDELSVDAIERNDGLQFRFVFPRQRFAPETVDHLARHLVEMLRGAAHDPATIVVDLPMIDAAEHRMLLEWGAGEPHSAPEHPIHEVISTLARSAPSRVAVESASDRGSMLTYGELDRRSNQLAHHLIDRGVKPGDPVALLVPRTFDLVVGLQAILKCGAVLVPLDAGQPVQRITAMIEDAGAVAVVTHGSLVELFEQPPPVAVVMDRDRAEIDGAPEDPVRHRVALDDLAYILFTSGSTGRPKGVEVDHACLAFHAHSMMRKFPLYEDDVVLGITSIAFDVYVEELMLPLVVGARIALADDHLRLDTHALAELLHAGDATVVMGTPTMAGHLLDSGWRPGSLRTRWGGEPLNPVLAERLLDTCAEVCNAYGPTEATVWATVHHLSRADVEAGVVPIGRPLPGRTVRIVDGTDGLVASGVEGELLLGGLGVARGYRGRPDATAAAFVDVPTESGVERMYRSGDRCRWRADGTIEFLGRVDRQTKINGHRLELGEVETVLMQHPGVTTAAADVRDGRLYAWVSGPSLPDAADVRRFATGFLPAATVPSVITPVESFPMLTSGKVAVATLPTPESVVTSGGDPPVGELELALAGLWCELLEIDGPVGRESDFFALGGSSLLAVRLVLEIERRFDCSVPLHRIVRLSVFADLAADVRSRRASGGVHEPDSDPLVLLRAGDADLPALFWVTGIGGLALAARRLADDVDPGMCVYSFDAALHRGASEPTSVADMADGYATRLVAATDGPFVVGGNSFGAMVAYVMACQLESRGRPPAGVVLVDPRLTLASHGWLVPRLWRYQVKTRERVSRWSRRLLRIPARRQRPPVPANVHAAKATNRALRSTFEPRSYGGDVTLVATRDRRMEHGRDLGLREFVDGEVTIVKLGGQHRGALSDHRLAILARATNEVLRRAQPAKQGGSARVSARDS